MKIVILAMDDPLYTNRFIKGIIDARKEDIVKFVYVSKGDRMTIGRDKSKIDYLLSLFLIMGPVYFFRNSLMTVFHKIQKNLSRFAPFIKSPLVVDYARKLGVDSMVIENPNRIEFIETLEKLEIDVIINQSQSIIKKDLLDIPKIGVINRHNALLPKNRGRLTPFWVLYKNEPETGVSIHFVEEWIDSGDIIVQKRFPIDDRDTFRDVVEKNYQLAGEAILEALDRLEAGDYSLIENEDDLASHNTTPTIKQAWEYRFRRILSIWNRS